MKKISIMTAIIVINFILQTSFYNFVDLLGVIPNISLILVVIFAIMTGGVTGSFFGLLTGFLYDVMLYDVFGIYSLIYFIIGALVGYHSEEVNRENYVLYCIITVISTVFMHVFLYIILFFLKYNLVSVGIMFRTLTIEIVLNTVFTVLILKFVILLFERISVK
ncbi:rod shape-determining protein MreD [Sedimentibacter sp. MB31-C6]|uniref:rod shape-determining protein MreD n=1 Tax=Sedimentibacter sp. MB31-C6 TaxID=3109366 RepID=UPI002DDCE90B|nr:rod shape-determining protein MreD [Sedimentibacter sp. MB36-C1]WSI04383.1 rod shape-determining protein MreD [Sedimentibacter sp. MB36-C1]